MDRGGARRADAKADFVPSDIDDGDLDIIPNHDGFATLARKNEHNGLNIIIGRRIRIVYGKDVKSAKILIGLRHETERQVRGFPFAWVAGRG